MNSELLPGMGQMTHFWKFFSLALWLLSASSIYISDEDAPGVDLRDQQIISLTEGYLGQNISFTADMARTLLSYRNMVLGLTQEEQRLLLIKTVPKSLEEALDLVVREVILYQEIYLEQIKAMEAWQVRPQDHEILTSHFNRYNCIPSDLYRFAKGNIAWCNILVRFIGWIARNPEKGDQQIMRLFEIVFTLYHYNVEFGRKGFKGFFRDFGDDRFSESYALILLKFREVQIPPPPNIRHTVWFHDNVSPALLCYSVAFHLLRPFLSESKLSLPSNRAACTDCNCAWPKELNKIASIVTFKLKQKSPNAEPSVKRISKVWNDICKLDTFKIASSWWDESVDDLDFERSYFDPLGSKDKKPESKLHSKSQHKIEKVDKTEKKSQNSKRKKAKKKKPAPKPAFISPKNVKHESTQTSFVMAEEPASHTSEDSTDSAIKSEKETEKTFLSDVIKVEHEKPDMPDSTDFESHKGNLESIKPEDLISVVSENALEPEPEVDEIIEDWEGDLLRERKYYELEKKKLAQIRKIIQQQKADKEKSERQAKIRQNLNSNFAKSKIHSTIIDSTELCLAYPSSYNLFLSNKGICAIKAKQYRWFFDPNVVIKQENIDFLCILFGLQSAKGQLDFTEMVKAYWAIESCFCKENEARDLSKNVFKWSHRFEINNFLCAPFKKSVHPEHESSRFNHNQALALFSSGGFDPRFFIPEY